MAQPMPTQYDTGMPQGVGSSPYQAMRSAMTLSFSAFREPRGVMRIIQFVFSICAFATITGYTNYVEIGLKCTPPKVLRFEYEYPFSLDHMDRQPSCTADKFIRLFGDFSNDAQFFVATGVLSFLYCIAIILIYMFYEAIYQNNTLIPFADFGITALLALLWLSASAAWANGLSGLKATTAPSMMTASQQCLDVCSTVATGSFSSLNISVILGFLNFFLWASDLWFLYKETAWFKMKQPSNDVNTMA